jgi:hypothetical protein
MMSLDTIRSLGRQAARESAREGRVPTIFEQDDITDALAALEAGQVPRLQIPFIGDRCPRGFKRTDNEYFVDSSGYGREGEPALTMRGFLKAVRPGFAYAVSQPGQFQVYVQEFEVRR